MTKLSKQRPIALLGSARSNGNTGALLNCVASELEMDIVDLSSFDISPYDYAHNNRADDFIPLLDRMLLHDDIIFASPVYWYTMSAQMKVFVDRLSDLLDLEELRDHGRALRGKRAHVLSTSISAVAGTSFEQTFDNTFAYMGIDKGAKLHVDCSDGFSAESCKQAVQSFISSIASPTPR